MWLRSAVHLALGASGAAWALSTRGSVLSAPRSWLSLSGPRSAAWIGLAGTLLLTLSTLWVTRWLVGHTRWAARLHLHLRSSLLGTTRRQMLVLASLAACSEEIVFRAALGPSLGFVGSSALFAVLHRGPQESPLQPKLWAFAMGLCLSALYLASGTLLAPVLAHALINYENMQYICNHKPTLRHIDDFRAAPPRKT